MANNEQLEFLKQGVKGWNQWRKENPDVRIDFWAADLQGVNLDRADLRNACLRQANFTRADLSVANLSGADLTQAYLIKADLAGAYLRKASLREANLLRGDLRGADLTEADLTAADLEGVDLTGADLTGANLTGARLGATDFTQANLTGVNLTDSYVGETIFGANDLSSTFGLEGIDHFGPSIIGTDTIKKSKGKIAIEFLRGCGLSDIEIEFARLAAPGLDPDQVIQILYEMHRIYCNQPIQFYSCFISYNSRDQAFAQRLHDDLQNNGVRCWFAPEDMKIGDEFRKAIGKEIRVRDKLLIILSQNSIRSEWVGDEVEKALAEEKEQGAPKLFPIRLDNAVFETKDDWAEKIRLRRHIGDFSSDYDKAFQRLLRDLKPQ